MHLQELVEIKQLVLDLLAELRYDYSQSVRSEGLP